MAALTLIGVAAAGVLGVTAAGAGGATTGAGTLKAGAALAVSAGIERTVRGIGTGRSRLLAGAGGAWGAVA